MKPRRRTYEVTLAGLLFFGVTGFVLLAAINTGTNPLYFAFGLMSGAMLVSIFMGAFMLHKVEIERITSDHAAAGEPTDVHYRLTNRKRWWPSFAIRVGESRWQGELRLPPTGYCLHLSPGETATIMSRLVPACRGILELREIHSACSFPFGFINRSLHDLTPHRIVVYPRIGQLNRQIALRCREITTTGPMTSEIRGGNDEFYGLREYRAGDNVKTIHWRRTARTGELLVRELTSDAPPQMIIALDLRSWRTRPDGLADVERAIEFAAALVCYGYMENFAFGLSIVGLDSAALALPRRGREQRARLLEALAAADAQKINPGPAHPPAVRAKSRAEWVIITLASTDPIEDTAPLGAPRLLLAMDHPQSADWVLFPDDAYSTVMAEPVSVPAPAPPPEGPPPANVTPSSGR